MHFLVIGAVLFAADRARLRAQPDAPPEPITVAVERVEDLRRRWRADTGREPSSAELDALVSREAEDEMLFVTAYRLGIHRIDTVVWRRLVQNMRFVATDSERTDAELFAEAVELGMDRSDEIVRQRLVERMRAMLAATASAEPSDDEIREFIARNPGDFEDPARVAFVHVFFGREQRGAAAAVDAESLLKTLVADGAGETAARTLGDRSHLPRRYPPVIEHDIAGAFGSGFARAVMTLAPGRWQGPLSSAFGWHLVWVTEARAAAPRPFEAVRERARHALVRQREGEAVAAGIAELRRRYRVQVGARATARPGS